KLVRAVSCYCRRVLAKSGLCASARRDCTPASSRTVVPYIRAAYRRTSIAVSSDLVVSGLEQSGRPLAGLATSGDPLPKLAHSGEPLVGLEQSGRSFSQFAGRGRLGRADS